MTLTCDNKTEDSYFDFANSYTSAAHSAEEAGLTWCHPAGIEYQGREETLQQSEHSTHSHTTLAIAVQPRAQIATRNNRNTKTGASVTLTLHLSHHRLVGLQPVLRGAEKDRRRGRKWIHFWELLCILMVKPVESFFPKINDNINLALWLRTSHKKLHICCLIKAPACEI